MGTTDTILRLEDFCWFASGTDAPLTFWSERLCSGGMREEADDIPRVTEVGNSCGKEAGETDEWS